MTIQVDLPIPTTRCKPSAVMKERLKAQGGRLNALVNTRRSRRRAREARGSAAIETDHRDWISFQVNFFAPIIARPRPYRDFRPVGRRGQYQLDRGLTRASLRGLGLRDSKAALAALTGRWPPTSPPLGIRVNAISPGEIDTAILSPGTETLIANIPMRRLGQPEEVQSHLFPVHRAIDAMINAPSFQSTVASSVTLSRHPEVRAKRASKDGRAPHMTPIGVTHAGHVDGKLGAVDIARSLGAQEIDGFGHLLWLPEPPHRDIGDQCLGAWRTDRGVDLAGEMALTLMPSGAKSRISRVSAASAAFEVA